MIDNAKTLIEYKEILGEKLKNLSGSENIKKEYKAKLFREILADPEYKTLKSEYLNKKRTESVKEKIFKDAFYHAKKINYSLTEEVFRAFLMGETKKKKSKEKINKSLEFEQNNFKINSRKWEEKSYGMFANTLPRVKVMDGGGAMEYIEWKMKWEQLFSYEKFVREVCINKFWVDNPKNREMVVAKYLMTIEGLKEKMADKPDHSKEYKNFFNTEFKSKLSGYWNYQTKRCNNIGRILYFWLANGYVAIFHKDQWYIQRGASNCYYSGRLLKD